jgi:hypothetical protein
MSIQICQGVDFISFLENLGVKDLSSKDSHQGLQGLSHMSHTQTETLVETLGVRDLKEI